MVEENCWLNEDDCRLLLTQRDDDDDQKVGSGQDVHSVLAMERLERTSSFGSASSSPLLASLPPIRVHVDDGQKVGGIEEQFGQMSAQQKAPVQVQDDVGGYVIAFAPVVVAGVQGGSTPVATEYVNVNVQQKQFASLDFAYTDLVSRDFLCRLYTRILEHGLGLRRS
ncbi:hypothetical protein M8C21_001221, partial [Ambrosia artemisiifolia]